MSAKFTNRIVRKIALKSLAYTVDCMKGVTVDELEITSEITSDYYAEQHLQNFEEDLEHLGFTVTEHRIERIKNEFMELAKGLSACVDSYYRNLDRKINKEDTK